MKMSESFGRKRIRSLKGLTIEALEGKVPIRQKG